MFNYASALEKLAELHFRRDSLRRQLEPTMIALEEMRVAMFATIDPARRNPIRQERLQLKRDYMRRLPALSALDKEVALHAKRIPGTYVLDAETGKFGVRQELPKKQFKGLTIGGKATGQWLTG